MKGATKAWWSACAGSAVATGSIYWFFTSDRGWDLSTYLMIWIGGTLLAFPGVLQDMANEKIIDGDGQPPPITRKVDHAARTVTLADLPGGEDNTDQPFRRARSRNDH